MPVRIRLRRVGRKKQPSYRIVVAESRSPRGGVYLDNVGFYNPRRDPIELRIDLTKVDAWIEKGAELTPTVASLVRRARSGKGLAPEAEAAAPAAEVTETPKAAAPKSRAKKAQAAPAEEEAAAAVEEPAAEESPVEAGGGEAPADAEAPAAE